VLASFLGGSQVTSVTLATPVAGGVWVTQHHVLQPELATMRASVGHEVGGASNSLHTSDDMASSL
jgi:hypothetical protein